MESVPFRARIRKINIYSLNICDALREKDPKRPSDNFRGERKEQASELDSVSDIPDSLSLTYTISKPTSVCSAAFGKENRLTTLIR